MGSDPRGRDKGNGLDALHPPASKKSRNGLSIPSNGSNASTSPNPERCEDVSLISRGEEMDASVSTTDRSPGDRLSTSKISEAESAGNKEKDRVGCDREGSLSVTGSGCSESLVEVRNEGRNIAFFDFERQRSCAILKKGEICAVRDEFGMPRQYALVQNDGNIHSASVRFIDQPYKHSGVLHVCGSWMAKTSSYSSAHIDPPAFSHIVGFRSFNFYDCNIYPRRGEVWAITAVDYMTAHALQKRSPTNQRYQMVEVLDYYGTTEGSKVVFLVRVKGGYRSLFRRYIVEGSEVTLNILPGDLHKFSHQVPSFRVSGKNSIDDCLDLDPSSLPPYIDEFTGSVEPEINDNYLCLAFLDHKIRKERFDKSGFIWAAYDQHGMPRKYIAIDTKKDSHSSMVQMHELVPVPSCKSEKKWHKAGLPIVCGTFIKTTIENRNQIIFSHEINPKFQQLGCKYIIYPRQGSIWGIYKGKGRDVVQNDNTREYQIVEIVEHLGDCITVAYLVRVEGFKCLFRRKSSLAGGALFQIPRNEFYRFSHHIPAYRFNKAYNEEIQYGSFILDPLLVPDKEGECFNFSDSFLLDKSKSQPLSLAIQHFVEKENNKIYLENQEKNCQQSELCRIYVTENREEHEGLSFESTRGKTPILEGCLHVKDDDIWYERALRKQGNGNKNMEAEADKFVGDVPSTEPEVESVYGEITLIQEGHEIREIQSNAVEVVGEESSNELEVNGAQDQITLRKQCHGSKDTEAETFEVNGGLDKIIFRMRDHGTQGIETETVKLVKKIRGNENFIVHGEPYVMFHDFYDSKSDTTFEVGQIWSLYDELDGLPRSYACINKFIPSETKVEVTMFEPHPMSNEEMQWVEENLPMGCGTFRASKCTTTKEISSLSHRVACKEDKAIRSYYRFFPRKGELWAVYKNWDASWTYSDWRNNLLYKLVEVISDFTEDRGITVGALIRVAGHEALFQRHVHEGFGLFQTFSRKELLRFSHCIPSLKLIDEKDNVSKELLKIKFSHHGL